MGYPVIPLRGACLRKCRLSGAVTLQVTLDSPSHARGAFASRLASNSDPRGNDRAGLADLAALSLARTRYGAQLGLHLYPAQQPGQAAEIAAPDDGGWW
jgi:hypothetical protein